LDKSDLGIKRFVAGNRRGAADYFTKSVETDMKSFTEYRAAEAMLSRLKEGIP
jgi:hypothetical protein